MWLEKETVRGCDGTDHRAHKIGKCKEDDWGQMDTCGNGRGQQNGGKLAGEFTSLHMYKNVIGNCYFEN